MKRLNVTIVVIIVAVFLAGAISATSVSLFLVNKNNDNTPNTEHPDDVTPEPEVAPTNYTDSQGVKYTLINNKYTVVDYEGTPTTVVIPEILYGRNVTSIGRYAFSGCSNLTKVNYLGTIDQWAMIEFGSYAYNNPLYYTNKLYINDVEVTEVVLTTATKISNYAFYGGSSITSVTICNSVISIGDYAFSNCRSVTSVTIGNSVTSIGSYAFEYCRSLTSVTIGDSVTSIGDDAFYNCSSITKVNYLGTIDQWAMIEFDDAYANPLSNGGKLYINDVEVTEVVLTTATKISAYVFYGCSSLTSVTIGENVTSIGKWAFYGCSSITSVTIPDSVTSIGYGAFYGCSSLTSIVFEDTTTWYRTNSSTDCENKTGGTSTSVTNSSTNATYFKSTYDNYYWYKI